MASTIKILNGDWLVDEASGQVMTVEGRDKTRQNFGEMLSIEIQSNGFGCSIVGLVGQVPDNPFSVSYEIMRRINDAVTRWIGLQRKQKAVLTDDEIVTRLTFNQAKVDDGDPTKIVFRAAIRTRSGDEVARGGIIATVTTVS